MHLLDTWTRFVDMLMEVMQLYHSTDSVLVNSGAIPGHVVGTTLCQSRDQAAIDERRRRTTSFKSPATSPRRRLIDRRPP